MMSPRAKTRKEAAMNKVLSTYGLAREPFTKDIAPTEMLQTEPLQEALQSLKAAVEGRASAVITGDSGCGKTCLLRALEEDLPQGRYRLHYAYNSTVNRRDFYRQLSIGMGLEPHSSFAALHASISTHIQELASQHKLRVIIVLDEAQLLCIQVLEQLHILLNFEKDSKPWLSLILIGLPDLRETLKRNVLASLTARMPIRIHLQPFDADQVKLYVRHRMNTAGCRREVFSDDALLLMSKATGGIMRRLDVLGEQCLIAALKAKSNIVDAAVVQKAVQICGEAIQ
jgi:general secretion pathway protein A